MMPAEVFSIGISLVDLVFSVGITLVDVHLAELTGLVDSFRTIFCSI